MTPLVDIGANLTNRVFSSDLHDVLARAAAASVETIVVTGTSVSASGEALRLAQSYPSRLWSTAGVHPHLAQEFDDSTPAQLRQLLQDSKCVAVGECGLDYDRDYSPRLAQRRAFESQLALAAESKNPVFLHERAAHEDFLAMVREFRPHLRAAVVHCFTGTGAELDSYLSLDLHVGVTGWICDERRGLHLRELVAQIPADRLMIETDAPYLLPRDLRPLPKNRRNEPALLPYVLRRVATCVGRDAEQVAAETTATARAFFGLSSP